MSHKEYALNQTNLARIGALDDFYEAYKDVYDIYEPIMEEVLGECQANNWVPESGKIDKLSRKGVKEICDPLLDKYKMIFTDDPNRLYLKTTKFSMEDFIPKKTLKLEFKIKTFDDFLVQLQQAVTSTLYGRRVATKPKYLLEPFTKEVDNYIERYIIEHDVNLIEEEHELTSEPLHVYGRLSSMRCNRERHTIVPDIYYGRALEDEKTVRLPVHYCKQCKKYLIGAVTYSMYENAHGIIVAEKYRYNDLGIDFDELCNESRLHRLGYNVIEGKLSEVERQSLLVFLMHNDIMTYFDITKTIENNISRFKNISRYGLAVSKWESDLKYISDLVKSGDISKK